MAVIDQQITSNSAIYNADCMEVLPSIKSGSVHLTVYSPPFPELYQYSNDPRDMSNCTTYQEGIDQYKFIVNQIHRVTIPGRITAVHCADLKINGQHIRDFPGDITRIHEEAGFHYISRITVWKDPWLVARRTRLRSLMHKMIVNDSTNCGIAGADYILVFKKPGENPYPVEHPDGLKTYAGEEEIPGWLIDEYKNFKGDQRINRLSHWIWRHYASSVWMDIRTGNLLPYKEAKETDEEKHVCPLQLDVIERLLTLYSNPGEIVLSPFGGVGSEPYMALKMGRKSIAVELKPSYYRQMLKNIDIVNEPEQPNLFDNEMPLDEEVCEDEIEAEL